MERSKVVLCKIRSITEKNRAEKLYGALEVSLELLTGKKELSEAVTSLFSKNEVIGIKVNTVGGVQLNSSPELIEQLCRLLVRGGIPEENLIIWDRLERELKKAGYSINTGKGIKYFATDSLKEGYDSELSYSGSVGSCFSKIVSSLCNAFISVPVLKDHDLSGVSLGMKNFYGAIHNPNKYHDNNCNPYIAELINHPYLKKRIKLTIIDGFKAQYHGGPGYNPKFCWPFNSLIFGTDPVAVDRIGEKFLSEKRKEQKLKSFKEEKREPSYLFAAESLGLGTADLKKIDLQEIAV